MGLPTTLVFSTAETVQKAALCARSVVITGGKLGQKLCQKETERSRLDSCTAAGVHKLPGGLMREFAPVSRCSLVY